MPSLQEFPLTVEVSKTCMYPFCRKVKEHNIKQQFKEGQFSSEEFLDEEKGELNFEENDRYKLEEKEWCQGYKKVIDKWGEIPSNDVKSLAIRFGIVDS